LAGVAEAAA